MDKRFFNIFNLTEERAIALLQTSPEQLEDKTDRYIAASHLINFPSERSINALVEVVKNPAPDLYYRITRRKAIESLGRLKAAEAMPVIQTCLTDEDCYTVENAVWAIGEIGTQDEKIFEEIAQLLDKPEQSYRVIIQTLAKFNYQPALDRIKQFIDSDNEPISSAAIATVARFTQDDSLMGKVVEFLQHESVNARRACIQDLIDAQYYQAIPEIAKCPVSVVFRLRGIRLLADVAVPAQKISFGDIEPYLDLVIRDRPDELNLVHEYDQTPTLAFAINELFQTDFGRCYLACQTILETYTDEAPEALMATFTEQADNDYGAHYHIVKLLGRLKYAPAFDLLVEALNNLRPQFQKSRAAAAIALANLGERRAIPLLIAILNNIEVWDFKYACLLALEQFGENSGKEIVFNDSDWLIRAKGRMV